MSARYPTSSQVRSGRLPRVPISYVVAVCALMSKKGMLGKVGVALDGATFSPKLGTSALREMLPNTCHVGSTSQSSPVFGLHRLKVLRPLGSPFSEKFTCWSRTANRYCVPAM